MHYSDGSVGPTTRRTYTSRRCMMIGHFVLPYFCNQQIIIATTIWYDIVYLKPGTHWRQSRLLPKSATISNKVDCCRYGQLCWRYGRLCCRFWQQKNQQKLEFDSLWWSTLSPVCTGPKQHGRLCRLSTKSTVLNSTLSPVCTGLYVQ